MKEVIVRGIVNVLIKVSLFLLTLLLFSSSDDMIMTVIDEGDDETYQLCFGKEIFINELVELILQFVCLNRWLYCIGWM